MTPLPARRHLRDPAAISDDVAVLAPRDGDRSLSLEVLRRCLGDLLEPGPSTLVLDLSGVRRLSSEGIDGLLWLHHRCTGRAVQVVLREPSRSCADLLLRAGLLGLLPVECPPGAGRRPLAPTSGAVG